LISGRPLFTADREHIHHKLLQQGWSPRQVVIALYAVSALFAVLSLFLLWPQGPTLGLVLVVIGAGVWFGVQHLGYLEFGEIRRIAQRTVEQRSIFVNNLAIRRATEELKGASDYAQVCHILRCGFSTNDFDGFELRVKAWADQPCAASERSLEVENLHFEWSKPDAPEFRAGWAAWDITLEVSSSTHRWRGMMKIYRFYTDRALLVDINLLTSVFPVVLADALERALPSRVGKVADMTASRDFLAAEAS
jgi:hypothetical protein